VADGLSVRTSAAVCSGSFLDVGFMFDLRM